MHVVLVLLNKCRWNWNVCTIFALRQSWSFMNWVPQEFILLHPAPSQTYSKARLKTRKLIEAVRQDKLGVHVLQQQRRFILEHSLPWAHDVAAVAVKYWRHFSSVQLAAKNDLEEKGELEQHSEVLKRLEKHLNVLPEPGQPDGRFWMPFAGDHVDKLICNVFRNWEISAEDEAKWRQLVQLFFPKGISICHFRDFHSPHRYAELMQSRCGYHLKQDSDAFYLERSIPGNGDYFHHSQFPNGGKIGSVSAGAWWGFKNSVWKSPCSQTHKRVLQAIAWLFVKKSISNWKCFNETWATIACNIRELEVVPRCLKFAVFFDAEDLMFKKDAEPVNSLRCSAHVCLRFRSSKGCFSFQHLKHLTFECIQEAAPGQAKEWHFKAFIAEFIWQATTLPLKKSTFQSCRKPIQVQRRRREIRSLDIDIRLREVKVKIFYLGACWNVIFPRYVVGWIWSLSSDLVFYWQRYLCTFASF